MKEIGITSRGYTIYVEEDIYGTGVNEYYSDEVGGGVHIYSSLLDPESVMLCLLRECYPDRATIKRIAGCKND